MLLATSFFLLHLPLTFDCAVPYRPPYIGPTLFYPPRSFPVDDSTKQISTVLLSVMAALRLLNLLAVTSLAILACSFNAVPANALSFQSSHDAHPQIRAHNAILKKKRTNSNSKRCKPRPAPTPAAAEAPSPTSESKPAKTSESSGNGNSGGSSGGSSGGNSGGNSGNSGSGSGNSGGNSGGGSGGSSSGGGSGKIGIAWSNPNDNEIRNVKTPNAQL